MYFRKIPHPANFRFPSSHQPRAANWRMGRRRFAYQIEDLGDETFRLRVRHEQWPCQHSQARLTLPEGRAPSAAQFGVERDGTLVLRQKNGQVHLSGTPQQSFGVCGKAWMLQLRPGPGAQYFGLGEKDLGFERSGCQTVFWNTDVWADHGPTVDGGETDPMYLSLPYVLVRERNRCTGILLNNPHACFVSTEARHWVAQLEDAEGRTDLYLGAPDGAPEIYLLAGNTVADVTRRLQRLLGCAPRPPLWALGHHQCRWGYAGPKDLARVERAFRRHRIPNDGLWLDIDYMDGYRVFTLDRKLWPNPSRDLAKVQSGGSRGIPSERKHSRSLASRSSG